MCANYAAARRDRPFKQFGVEPRNSPWRDEVCKGYPAPIVRRLGDAERADVATFGMVPREHIPPGVCVFCTMNALAEPVSEKRSFSGAWKLLQLCLIACEAFYGPNYESGKAVRRRINMVSGEPFAIGLWREWDDGAVRKALSFTMLTVNSSEHPVMRRFHKPGI
ncbi:SOS response-associated peptidase family protein [Paraburkholderia sp. CNPSo 3076]|uniref:SOS response-associated peptidase family protein n=1 Tax=Paraburkholderia sp. CNPSo 3076 TaxID=2940936 RepID=UPI00224EE478|nr:SOS response-associated peptidase family protein [Paraburkholderia sp. CNPSo 3076]MCX5538116.1 SOS response-associated peptidase family protein [Paraburkholderia sp. CNPSo 3076]